MIVVKLGGSLFDHPALGPGLAAWMAQFGDEPCWLVPGGGEFAEGVRNLDRIHHLGEEAAHWLAIDALAVSAAMIRTLVPRAAMVNVREFCETDHVLPHTWETTTDSIAARVALVRNARLLILLKSIDIPAETPWPVAATNCWVDAYFPTLAAELGDRIVVLNFRTWLDRFTISVSGRRPPDTIAP